jgi:hypothetical protein
MRSLLDSISRRASWLSIAIAIVACDAPSTTPDAGPPDAEPLPQQPYEPAGPGCETREGVSYLHLVVKIHDERAMEAWTTRRR